MRLTSLAMVAVIGLTLLSTSACGADNGKAAARPNEAEVKAAVAERLGIKVEDIQPSPVPGLYEVVSGTDVGYVSADGRFYVDGDVFDMQTRRNLTDQRRKEGRVALLKGIQDSDAIVFAPKDARYTLDVFTDVDCTYCRKLHSQIDQFNSLGIKVRYLMFPRSGPGSPAWQQAQAVWCSADRRDALTRAKRGEHIEAKACKDSIAKQYALGEELGVRGTPGIFTEDGEYIAGYMPPAQLLQHLKSLDDKG
jgi:thiol:disulfide interchange protein DsbC